MDINQIYCGYLFLIYTNMVYYVVHLKLMFYVNYTSIQDKNKMN